MSSNRKSQRDVLRSFIWLPGRGLRCVFSEYQSVPPLAACMAWAVACANAFITCGTKLELFNNVSRLAELYYSQRRYAVAKSFAKRLLDIAEKDRGRESATVVASPALARRDESRSGKSRQDWRSGRV
jgi:hypothetical protein